MGHGICYAERGERGAMSPSNWMDSRVMWEATRNWNLAKRVFTTCHVRLVCIASCLATSKTNHASRWQHPSTVQNSDRYFGQWLLIYNHQLSQGRGIHIQKEGYFLGEYVFPVLGMFFWISVSLLLCFSVSLLFAFLLFPASAFMLLCFSTVLLLCFFAFLLFFLCSLLCFFVFFSASLLLCFSTVLPLRCFLLFCFSSLNKTQDA